MERCECTYFKYMLLTFIAYVLFAKAYNSTKYLQLDPCKFIEKKTKISSMAYAPMETD